MYLARWVNYGARSGHGRDRVIPKTNVRGGTFGSVFPAHGLVYLAHE